MKRLIVAVLVGGMVFGTVLALAASLDVNGGTIQAGSDTDLQCDEDGIDVVGWMLETDDGLVYGVRIHNIDPACIGNDLFVNITGTGTPIVPNTTIIAQGSATIPPDTNAAPDNDPDSGQVGVKVHLNPDPAAVDITDIEVFIEGPSG